MTLSEKALLKEDWARIKAFSTEDKVALLWRVPLLLLCLALALLWPMPEADQ